MKIKFSEEINFPVSEKAISEQHDKIMPEIDNIANNGYV